jgi:hypothetical protein
MSFLICWLLLFAISATLTIRWRLKIFKEAVTSKSLDKWQWSNEKESFYGECLGFGFACLALSGIVVAITFVWWWLIPSLALLGFGAFKAVQFIDRKVNSLRKP